MIRRTSNTGVHSKEDGALPACRPLEVERERLVKAIAEAGQVHANVTDLVPGLIDEHRALVTRLEQVTLRDVSQVREELRRVIDDEIQLIPTGDHLVAEFGGNCVGLKIASGNNYPLCGTEERT